TTFDAGPFSFPSEMATDASGNIWYSEPQVRNAIARLDPVSGAITEYPLGSGTSPSGIVQGFDHNIWFAERGASMIGCLRVGDSTMFHYTLGLTTGGKSKEPARLIRGPGIDRNPTTHGIWFSEVANNALGQLEGTCGAANVSVVE